MKRLISAFLALAALAVCCGCATPSSAYIDPDGDTVRTRFIPPEGFYRVESDGYGEYLRDIRVLPEGTQIRKYDGTLVNSGVEYCAVLDVDVGTRDLQQCADSALRLRCEYLFSIGAYDQICYQLTSGDELPYTMYRDGYRLHVENGTDVSLTKDEPYDESYETFREYYTDLFRYAGTISIERESQSVAPEDMQIGDVFVIGGSPGHLMFVLDMVCDDNGRKAFLIAQGNTPAQQMHVLVNSGSMSPWLLLDESSFPIVRGDLSFGVETLKRMP
ncbi:MAG: DUF4846 domain-containing protein [Clostridia bacterium]|nr:DUF4846 domain-containing protein [Clostridia bacterium]